MGLRDLLRAGTASSAATNGSSITRNDLNKSVPALPLELAHIILDYFAAQEIEDGTPDDPTTFRKDTDPAVERTLSGLSGTRLFHKAARELLFRTVHIGTADRAEAFLRALKADMTVATERKDDGAPNVEKVSGLVAPLVKLLRITVASRRLTRRSETVAAVGVQPAQVSALAKALPHIATLDIVCVGGSRVLDQPTSEALRELKQVKDLEIVGTGYVNAIEVLRHLQHLELLKLKDVSDSRRNEDQFRSRQASALAQAPTAWSATMPTFARHLHTLTIEACDLTRDGAELCGPNSGIRFAHLRHLHVAHSRVALDELFSHRPSRADELVTFHLVGGNVPASDVLERSFFPSMTSNRPALHHLWLSGEERVRPMLFDLLSTSAVRLKSLRLSDGARSPLLRRSPRYPDDFGLEPGEMVEALDKPWASELERLDVSDMQEYEDPVGRNGPVAHVGLWDYAAISTIQAKIDILGLDIVLVHSCEPVEDSDWRVDAGLIRKRKSVSSNSVSRSARRRQA